MRTDVAIIGGGAIGSAVAYFSSCVTLLGRHDEPACLRLATWAHQFVNRRLTCPTMT
jgi:glycine/D-amino acid oxidase-like deaminating enzyme